MLGNNSQPGDKLVATTTSSDDLKTLAWIHDGTLEVLLICKVDYSRTILIKGLRGQLRLIKIDNTLPWTTPQIQESLVGSTDPLIMNGYTVALLQGSVPA
jgi:hypothetical protein